LDKCIDIGAIVDPVQLSRIRALVDACSGQKYHSPAPLPAQGCFYPPTLITGLAPADPLMQEEIFGPVLVSTTFRTPEEAVSLANNSRYGLAATVWTENVNLALDIAPKLKAGVVWVNATNLFDAAAGFGGVRESGFGREGGWEGIAPYRRGPALRAARPVAPVPAPVDPVVQGIDRTAKLYIGGKQVRPDGGYSRAVWSPGGHLLGHVPLGNRKDIRNAVEAAQAAQKGWARTTAWNRAQVLYYMAENLAAREAEFASRIRGMTGKPGEGEVRAAIAALFRAAAFADKWEGRAKPVPIRGIALALPEPQGVIGIVAPDDQPLLGLIALAAPAIALGNAVITIPSRAFPLAATDLYQVIDTSDVPPGVWNIVTGDAMELGKTLAGHMDVEAVWAFGPAPLGAMVERESVSNLKRTWVSDRAIDWATHDMRETLRHAADIKTVWVPYGE
jgi:aldehyde dehydrogenase (NAD+)